jgi:nucleotide-binding universal stress UspA family protein
MFKNILVGVDGRDGGQDAIMLARHLLGRGGALTLAYVYNGDTTPGRGSSPAYDAAERERGLELLTAACFRSGADARLRTVGSPSVGRGLHVLAEAAGCDLLVVGSSRRGLLGRVLLGDDTRASLNGASCAVAVAPVAYAEGPALMREIGVGYDGSAESEQALAVARALASELDATVSAFTAVSLPHYMYMGGPTPADVPIEQIVEEARERIAALGGVEPHAAFGAPAEELALFGASVDLLVVGSRSYGPVGRLMHGSTSLALARTARCPLLVLPRATRVVERARTNGAGIAVSSG